MNDQIDYAALKQRVDARVEQQKRLTGWILLGGNIAIFLIFLVITIGLFGSSPVIQEMLNNDATSEVAVGIILPFIGWLMSITYHGISLAAREGGMEGQIRKQILAREMGSLMYDQLAQAAGEQVGERLAKPKREGDTREARYVELGDDGELIDVPAEEPIRRRSEQR